MTESGLALFPITALICDTTSLENDALFEKALSLVSSHRREKVLRTKHRDMQASSLGAGLLLAHILMENNIDINTLEIGTNKHGKPYFKNCDILFSLSHSGKMASCAVSFGWGGGRKKNLRDKNMESSQKGSPREAEIRLDRSEYSAASGGMESPAEGVHTPRGVPGIGIDIERISRAKNGTAQKLANRFFSKAEADLINNADSHALNAESRIPDHGAGISNRTEILFTEIWTRKEAYAKRLGVPLTHIIHESLPASGENGFFFYTFTAPDAAPEYVVSLCTDKKTNPALRGVCIEEILNSVQSSSDLLC